MPNLSPGGWLDLLDARLSDRQPSIIQYNDYYAGKQRLAFASERFKEAFGYLFAAFADNWCGLIVDAAAERLTVEGFRFGTDDAADQAAWDIWQANNLDADSQLGHREAIKAGEAYVLVDPNNGDPTLTVEHPGQVIVAMAPGSRRHRLAALKRWVDDDGFVYATVYLPDAVHKFRSQRKYLGLGGSRITWERRSDDPGGVNTLGVVPVVPLANNPSLLAGGQSDLRSVIPLQDAANKVISDLLVASEYQSYQQRYATGLQVVKDGTGAPVHNYQVQMSLSKLLVSENPDTKFGSFPSVDLKPYVAAVEMIVQHLAAQTRTPPHYLLGNSGAFPSGESLKATETGLVARVVNKQVTFGEGWEEAIRLAFLAKGDLQRANALDAETIWRDPESRTESEHVDATLKLQALGVPVEALWERVGFTPQQIKRFKQMKAKEAQRAARLAPQQLSAPQSVVSEPSRLAAQPDPSDVGS